jgi:hypothetical protein
VFLILMSASMLALKNPSMMGFRCNVGCLCCMKKRSRSLRGGAHQSNFLTQYSSLLLLAASRSAPHRTHLLWSPVHNCDFHRADCTLPSMCTVAPYEKDFLLWRKMFSFFFLASTWCGGNPETGKQKNCEFTHKKKEIRLC